MTDDAELLRRYLDERSEAAFAALVERHIGLVYAAALRQLDGSVHRARDVTQSVFIDLARKAPRLRARRELAGWLHTSTHYAAAKLKRGEQRRQRREEQAHAMTATDDCPEIPWDHLRPVLDDAMHELSDDDRDVILLRYFEGCRYGDIGRRLGLGDDAARMRVDRALERLRQELARRKVTSTAAALALALGSQPSVAVPAGLTPAIAAGALAATSAGGGAAVLAFMNTKTVFAGSALLALGAALYYANENRSVRAAAASFANDRDRLQSEVRRLEGQIADAVKGRADGARELQAERSKTVSAGAGRPSAISLGRELEPDFGSTRTSGGGFLTLTRTPSDPAEARRQQRENEGHNIDNAFAAFFQQLDLPPELRAQLKNILLDVRENRKDLFKAAIAAAKVQNPNLTRAEMYEIAVATQDEIGKEQVAAVRQAMGDRVGDSFERYVQTLPVRSIATNLGTALFYSDTPLTTTQANELVEVLARHAVGPLGKVDLLSLNAEAALAEVTARGLLAPAQLLELRQTTANAQRSAKAQYETNTRPAGGASVPR